jgi:5-(carboxyamino)imidazole ribonucleotide synthase
MPDTPSTKKRIGIVGGGQLGRMLTYAAHKLGFHVTVLDPTPNSPAAQLADEHIVKDFATPEGVYDIARNSDYLTFEIESANADALKKLVEEGKTINPSPDTLLIIKDKFQQKVFLEKNGIPVAPSVEVNDRADVERAGKEFGYPFLLKARFGAYDGRGNALIKDESEIEAGMLKLQNAIANGGLYVEKYVPFVKELAVVVARGVSGEILPYPPVETIHKNNICHLVLAPAPIDQLQSNDAKNLAARIMTYLQGVGVFAIEMFVTSDGQVLVNEIAPRVHNSGHYTIEGHNTSQFEQHIRAITGMPLGDIEPKMPASVMINILGERSGPAEIKGLEEALAIPGTAVHIYGKLETRPERKMGHITIVDTDIESALEKAKRARLLISI